MPGYDLLAEHYDAVTGDSSTEAEFVDSLIRHASNRAMTLLEVACGTGNIIAALAGKYRVSGLDVSPGVLTIARDKLPAGTALYQADMSDFRLDARFDAIICVYHGINHLLSFAAWKRFFDCAHRHLNDGGILIFDIMTIDDLKLMASMPRLVQQSGENCLRIKVHANDEAVFEWNIELFERQRSGTYELLTEVIRTASYPPAEIQEALGEVFSKIQVIESDGSAVDDDSGKRVWFVCAKPAREPG